MQKKAVSIFIPMAIDARATVGKSKFKARFERIPLLFQTTAQKRRPIVNSKSTINNNGKRISLRSIGKTSPRQNQAVISHQLLNSRLNNNSKMKTITLFMYFITYLLPVEKTILSRTDLSFSSSLVN